MGRILIIIGLAIVVVGLLWPWLSHLGIGRLPGADLEACGERAFGILRSAAEALIAPACRRRRARPR